MRIVKSVLISLLMVFAALSACAQTDVNPKREFRGAWLHVIGQTQYMNKSPEQCRQYISGQLDRLTEAGCNAVIFQVRPTADAMYKSPIEPWSSWLTGKRGKAPVPEWDPLEYVVDEAHKRGMEVHAWLNPYRVTSSPKEVLPADHLSNQEPHRFFRFDGKIFFDPAYEENRQYIANVVSDIVTRYDVDAIHFDDYFYPYPSGTTKFNGDSQSYAKMGNGMNVGDWRRQNVDKLIELVSGTIKDIKPWVRFGISPFGIWRNRKSDSRGSESSGLQNYDDLYADVLLWADKGWIDYLAPQLYWQLDLKVAPSRKLAKWWNDNVPQSCDLYIGQDVQRTMTTPCGSDKNELATKVNLSRELPNVDGNVWWHGYWVTENYKGALDSLASKHQASLALAPAYGDKSVRPTKIVNLRHESRDDGSYLTWDVPRDFDGYGAEPPLDKESGTDVVKYVVYEFFEGEDIDLEAADAIIAITPFNAVKVDQASPGTTFVVTSIDRQNRESEPSQKLRVK